MACGCSQSGAWQNSGFEPDTATAGSIQDDSYFWPPKHPATSDQAQAAGVAPAWNPGTGKTEGD